MAYYIPKGYTPTVLPHGNAKSTVPYFPTLPSTAQLVKQECKDSGPKKVVASVSVSLGGILDATYPGELPRNEQQVSNYRKKQTKVCSATNSQPSTEANDLYAVMFQAHLEDVKKNFARDIKAYPEPAAW